MRKASNPCHGCDGPKFIDDGRLCKTCQGSKAKKKAASQKAWAARIEKTYQLTDTEYFLILEEQGGGCYICRRKAGRRRLSVDHDHQRELILGVRKSIRGLLCKSCNDTLGMWRDDVEVSRRATQYLLNPPARRVLK